MARREQMSIGKLYGGPNAEVSRFLKMYVCVPALIVADRFFASAAMHNGVYTVVNSGLPGDGLAHNVTCCVTDVDTADPRGILTVVGKNIKGLNISEVITPGATGVTVQGLQAFKQVISITGSAWSQGGTGADTIVIGFGEVLGMPDKIAATGDLVLVAHNTALVNAPTVVVGAVISKCTVLVPTGDGTKKLRVLYQV